MSETKLYRHFDAAGTLLYVGVSLSAIARLQQHHGASHWAGKIATVTIETFPTRLEAEAAERDAIFAEAPLHNARRYARPRRQAQKPDAVEVARVRVGKGGRLVRDIIRIPAEQWAAAIEKASGNRRK